MSQEKGSLRLLILLVALGVGVYWFARRSSGPETGTLAADFSLPVVSGGVERVQLSELRGRPVLVEVVASWCGVCRRAAPTLAAAAKAPRQREVRFLAVSVDEERADAAALAKKWDIPYDVAHDDGRFARSYRIDLLPTFVLIDAEGRIRKVSTGAPKPADVERWLAEVGAERL
ncbi:MAG: TlpA family protein disulfide reductase [Myxococcales bacterium]|nr:TlpA family protein disulfide reductase [Myxococcales bacterium]